MSAEHNKTKAYKISLPSKLSFYEIIEHKDPFEWVVSYGGIKKGCVKITISAYDNKYIAHLHASYEKECALSGILPKHYGTIQMIHSAIEFTFLHFPMLDHIFLKDWSYVKCNTEDLYLPPLQLALYGKTWYERHFNAIVEKDKYRKKIDKYIEISQKEQTWKKFEKKLGTIQTDIQYLKIKPKLQEIFTKHRGIIRDIILEMKNEKDCDILLGWLKEYFHTIISFQHENIYYIIQKSAFTSTSASTLTSTSTSTLITKMTELKEDPYETSDAIKQRITDMEHRMKIFMGFTPRSYRDTHGGNLDGANFNLQKALKNYN
jgi:hypothetical protein